MILDLKYGKHGLTIQIERNPNVWADRQRKREAAKEQGGNITYQNCVFGQPMIATIPTAQTEPTGTREGAIDYASAQTGIQRELAERLLDAIEQYYRDRSSQGQG